MPIQKQSWSAGDEMTSAKLNNTGFISFSGDGSDGALNISSGTTTVDCSNEPIVHLNYTSVSITGTAKLAFSNPYSGGTTIILTSQGDVTLTSSDLAMIDASGMGASAQTNASNILDALQHYGSHGDNGQGSGSEGGVAFTNLSFYNFHALYDVL